MPLPADRPGMKVGASARRPTDDPLDFIAATLCDVGVAGLLAVASVYDGGSLDVGDFAFGINSGALGSISLFGRVCFVSPLFGVG
jgi:hypothetical protein